MCKCVTPWQRLTIIHVWACAKKHHRFVKGSQTLWKVACPFRHFCLGKAIHMVIFKEGTCSTRQEWTLSKKMSFTRVLMPFLTSLNTDRQNSIILFIGCLQVKPWDKVEIYEVSLTVLDRTCLGLAKPCWEWRINKHNSVHFLCLLTFLRNILSLLTNILIMYF